MIEIANNRILVIDDEEVVRDSLRLILTARSASNQELDTLAAVLFDELPQVRRPPSQLLFIERFGIGGRISTTDHLHLRVGLFQVESRLQTAEDRQEWTVHPGLRGHERPFRGGCHPYVNAWHRKLEARRKNADDGIHR